MRRGLLSTVLLVVMSAGAQQPADLRGELEHLGAAAQSLQRDLPSFECTETALSQSLKKGKVKEQVRFVADLRVQRDEEAGRLHEQLGVSEVNGRPYREDKFEPPFMVLGGFGESLFFFLPVTETCFHYSLSKGRIDFDSPPGTFERRECGETGAPRGFALLDDAGNVVHLERQVPPEFARQVHVVDSTAIDFVPTELDGKVYLLPSRMVADVPKEDGVMLHFEATYAGCHLFKATSRILPGVTPVPESVPGPQNP